MNNNKFNPHNRRRARRYALQGLYQWKFTGSDLVDIERYFLNEYSMDKVEVPYLQELLHEVPKQGADLDAAFKPFLVDREVSELDPIELITLRMGTYELMKRLDIPYKVAINEAVELCKKFGTVEGYKYVNAVLDKLASTLRPHE